MQFLLPLMSFELNKRGSVLFSANFIPFGFGEATFLDLHKGYFLRTVRNTPLTSTSLANFILDARKP